MFVPHAGISYSGNTAASGFKQIEGKNYSRIILLGSSHRHLFSHAAVFDQGSWKTPLGNVKIDENLATAILDKKYNITADISPHNEEHSLEVELIFLQKVLKNFRIVPILVSQSSDELINNLAQKISDNFDDQTLLVVSSDLSHYPTWETANLVDKQTIKAILTGKKELFERSIAELESKKYPNVETLACGAQSIRVGLKMAEILNLTDFKKIAYENSGDVSGDRSRVVGYGAIGVWSEKITSAPNQLGKQSQAEALDIARKTLDTYLNTDTVPAISPDNQDLLMPLGAFVTLRKMGELRGCIGEFESSIPLFQVVQNMTVAAATKDSRFLPVTKDELKQIKIEISVMTRKKKIENWKSVRLGKDGVVVQKGFQSGAFLPQVANETEIGRAHV